ncbi:PTS sugar transporter subunit IIA [Reinekea sp.]|jgi:PTS system nitrogen regulatory IIA component|uniref:PTS sugar transporter subunit IIA n=1 Tax=Reinekea sp. TaxID=1970455 RepID=UPI002A80D501|nr:PTS sugar transporter subunit IIA [Reinekea sp.]
MIPLDQVLRPERTFAEDFGASKKKVLQTLAERLSQTLSGVSDVELFDQLIARERLGSTGIGSGVAIPHCRLAGLDKATAALVLLTNPINFEAIDKKPVDLVFALVVPIDATDEHLQLLAMVVEKVNDPASLALIRQCSSATALYEQFVGAPK